MTVAQWSQHTGSRIGAERSGSRPGAVGSDDGGFAEVEDHLVDAGLRAVVDRLPEPDRSVVRRRFGFEGDQPASYASIAKRLHLSVRTVRRCERRALEALGRDGAVAAAHAA